MIRLLLVDANQERCTWLCQCLERAGFAVVGLSSTVKRALHNIVELHPQIVLVAPQLNDISGAQATRTIMEQHATPVVLMTNAEDTNKFEPDANWCGATAIVTVPKGPDTKDNERHIDELVNTLRLMHEVPVVKRSSSCPRTGQNLLTLPHTGPALVTSAPCLSVKPSYSKPPSLIAIASSTGGPAVVQAILSKLPAHYPIPIVLVQHLSKGFSEALVRWLDEQLALHVVEIADGSSAAPGYLHVASGQQHLQISSLLTFHLLPHCRFPGHCPSATAMFNSLATACGSRALGIVLTGMGDDGSEGMLNLRKCGAITYAQDEASCVISSMPKQAVMKGAVTSVLKPAEISDALLRYADQSKA